MITIQQHIDGQHGGNVSAFARSVSASRPTVYRWLERGAVWHAGRVWDPVTPAYQTGTPALRPLQPTSGWRVESGTVVLSADICDLQVTTAKLNAADLAAMDEALNNEA